MSLYKIYAKRENAFFRNDNDMDDLNKEAEHKKK